MPIIALQGIRAGVGVTSITASLAWALQQLGEPVLAIDFAPENFLRLHFNTPFVLERGWARAQLEGGSWQQGAMHYCDNLDFLPFGQLSAEQLRQIDDYYAKTPHRWRDNLAQIQRIGHYRWILLDVPAGAGKMALQALACADDVFLLLNSDMNCQVRIHQQTLPTRCHFLVNNYFASSRLQQGIHQLWLKTLPQLLPVMIHHDEALAESFAMKQPLGEYCPQSQAADELLTLANWCLINSASRQQ